MNAVQARWAGPATIALNTLLALLLYTSTAAPDLTWAHYGADGGDLLAAAAVNGVPHPTGYPLYTMLLQAWLAVGRLGDVPPARLGNLFSAVCAALSVGLTVATAAVLLGPKRGRWVWAGLAGLAWTASPLLWSQALITEVYALHALLVAAVGWALLTVHGRRRWLVPALALTAAHHLTGLLLWPAVAYLLWVQGSRPGEAASPWYGPALRVGGTLAPAALLGGLLYLRIPWAAAEAPPVNWGYADNWTGLWWLVSGAAYRDYLFGVPWAALPGRIAAWARLLTLEYTVVGLALVLLGLADWDHHRPHLRTFGILWVLPVSLYAIAYNTGDSQVYLLPVVWLGAVWLANGLAVGVDWLQARKLPWAPQAVAASVLAGLLVLVGARIPALSLRGDAEARTYLSAAAAVLEPASLVVSSADAETFALWYGAWGSGTLAEHIPDLVLVNYALYQFDWYRRLLVDLYPDVPGVGGSFAEMIAANVGRRPIYTTEPFPEFSNRLVPKGPLWQLMPDP